MNKPDVFGRQCSYQHESGASFRIPLGLHDRLMSTSGGNGVCTSQAVLEELSVFRGKVDYIVERSKSGPLRTCILSDMGIPWVVCGWSLDEERSRNVTVETGDRV